MTRPLDGDHITARLTTSNGRWQRIEVLETVDSTNARSEIDPAPWRIVTAAEQSAGRGRHDRSWLSPPGASVSLSCTVPVPAGVEPAWFPLLVGIAVRQALTSVCGPDTPITLKWPNDVLDAQDRKLCGILCQLLPGNLLLAGIGINVRSAPQIAAELTPKHAGAPPTPVVALADLLESAAHGGSRATVPTREDVVVAVASAVDSRHRWWQDAGDAAVRDAYVRSCSTLGRDVVVHRHRHEPLNGRAIDVEKGGGLVVRAHDDAETHVFVAGDVMHVRPGNGA